MVPLIFQRFPPRIISDISFKCRKLGWIHKSTATKVQSPWACDETLPLRLSVQRQQWKDIARMLWSYRRWWVSICSLRNRLEIFQNFSIDPRNSWGFWENSILTVPKPRKGGAIVVNIRKRVLKLAKSKAQSKIRRIANFFLWNSTHCHARDASNYFRDPFISLPQTRFRFFRLFMTDVRIPRIGTFFWQEFSQIFCPLSIDFPNKIIC